MKAQVITDHKFDLFEAGFAAAGYEIVSHNPNPAPDDVVVAWNRKFSNEQQIARYERAGAKVIITENGYIGRDAGGHRLIALAHNHHLGAGRWFVGRDPRWRQHGFDVKPWRTGGEEIVILAQRGIGNAKTLDWAEDLANDLRRRQKRPVRVREHPGKAHTPVEPDLERAHAVVTWSSAAALYALAFGVPAFHLMPNWIGAPASVFGVDNLESPYKGDRTPAFHRVGWAQWTQDEIRSGEAVRTVMRV